MKSVIVSPSLLSADFGELRKDVEMLNESDADWIHLDIMDGVFVPNISFGFPVVKYIQKYAKKPLDVHLMIVQPENFLKQWREYGAEILTVHYEACNHLHRTVQEIKSLGMKAGVSINPHTPVNLLKDIIYDLDLVLIMSVNPGFAGQSFIKQSILKISELRELSDVTNPTVIIEVDGGIDLTNYREIVKAGANALVAGSSVFGSEDPKKIISKLKYI